MHVCLWLHLLGQDCKLCLRFSDGCNWKWLKLHSVLLLTSLLCNSSSTRQVLLTSLLCNSSARQVPVRQPVCQKEDLSQKKPLLAFFHFFALDQTTWYRRTPVQVPSWFSAQQDDKTRPKAPSDQMYLRTRKMCFIKSFF